MLFRITIILACIGLCFGTSTAYAQEPGYQGCQKIEQLVEDECIALERLFENAGGLDWFNRTGWLRENQPCTWFGVTCNSKEWPLNVIKIELVDNNVSGGLPGELGNLSELQELIIENTSGRGGFDKLENILPSTLSFAKNLRVIRLGQNAIRGAIPNTYGRLENLEVLDLHDNLLDGFLPDSLSRMPNLREIDLSENDLKGNIPPTWTTLDNLEFLNLSENKVNGNIPEDIGNLQKLRSLRLQNNELTGRVPQSLGSLPNLNLLDVSGNALEGLVVPAITELSSQLSFCSLADNSASLCVPNRAVYEVDEAGLFCGVSLSDSCSICDGNNATDEGTCRGLEALYFDTKGYAWDNDNNWLVNDSPCEWFGIGCENDEVASITLPNNNLTGSLPDALGQLASLTTLDLSQNQLDGTLPFSVAALGANLNACSLSANSAGLCIPETEQYRDLGRNPICQLPLSASCAPLPARISNFEARIEGNQVIISWSATSVDPASLFYVEKKVGNTFVQAGSVDGATLRNAASPFELSLIAGPPGVHTYRIREDLPNGSSSHSISIEVRTGVNNGLLVGVPYPNPATNTAYMDLLVEEGDDIEVTLFNAIGQRIRTLYSNTLPPNTPHLIEIDRSQLAGGLYFVQVRGRTFSRTETLVFTP